MKIIFFICFITLSSASPISNLQGYQADKFLCFDKADDVPVNLNEDFENECCDRNRVFYKENATLTSCCECLVYTCTFKGQMTDFKGNVHKFFSWKTTVSDMCCTSCNQTVYKADTVIDTTVSTDSCGTVKTDVCKIVGESNSKKVAEIVQDIKYEKCCNYPEEKPHALGTEKDDAETCSKLVCEASNILPYANWVSKSVYDGCGCCLFNGKMYEPGQKWVLFNPKFNADVQYECCEGKVLINENPPKPSSEPATTGEATQGPITTGPIQTGTATQIPFTPTQGQATTFFVVPFFGK